MFQSILRSSQGCRRAECRERYYKERLVDLPGTTLIIFDDKIKITLFND